MTTHATSRNYLAIALTVFFVCFIAIVQFPLIFITPALEYKKIELFRKYNLPVNERIEFLYFVLLLFQISLTLTLCYCCCYNDVKQLSWKFSVSTLLWIIIPIIYTHDTIHELGDVPISCPSNYKYSFSQLRYICRIRTANLICMWTMFYSTCLATFVMHIPESKYKKWFGDDENEVNG